MTRGERACVRSYQPRNKCGGNFRVGTERKSRTGEVISEAGGTPAAPSADRPQPPLTQTGPGRLLMANPEFSRAQAVSAVRVRHLISGVRTSQNYHLMIVVDRHTVVVFGADTA